MASSASADPLLFLRAGSSELEPVADVVAAAKLAAARPELDAARLVVCGHSDGAVLAPRIHAALRGAGIREAGLVVLCGFGETLATALLFQQCFAYEQLQQAPGCLALAPPQARAAQGAD